MAQASTRSPLSWLRWLWSSFRSAFDINGSSEVPLGVAEEGRPARERRTEEHSELIKKFRNYEKYDGVRIGWPGLAHQQNYAHNRSFQRRFGTLSERLLLDLSSRISSLELELESLDKIDEKINPSNLQSLPNQQSSADEAALNRRARKDDIMKELHDLVPNHARLVLLQSNMRRLPRISRLEHLDYVKQIAQDNMLDESAREFMYDADDFVTTRTDRQHEPFELLVYGNNWLYRFLKTRFLSKTNPEGKQEVSKARLKKISNAVTVSFTQGLLLSPVLILLLLPLDNAHSALVLVVFGLITTTAMALYGIKSEKVFYGTTAVMAVLVALLGSRQDCQCKMAT
ncbi:hypothetical protein V8F20_003784 [Naviculisporaceae sp. PSN 640]